LKVNRFLAGTLALVLIAGLGAPAFAVPSTSLPGEANTDPSGIENIMTANEVLDVIFDGGAPNGINANEVTGWVQAEDFVLEDDVLLTDFHFWTVETGTWDGTVEFFLFEDDGGQPAAAPFASGTILEADLTKEATGNLVLESPEFQYWIDLETPIELEAGITYWFGLHLSNDFDIDSIFWEHTSEEIGLTAWESSGGTFDNWFSQSLRFAFFLTGHPPEVVGGEFLPIDSTALMLAGLQSSAIWMIPTLAGLAGAGFYLIKFRTNKE